MSSRTITFRFSDEVINVIEAQARATGSNRTAVVLNALTECYGLAAPTSSSAIERLQQQVQQLESQLIKLSEQLTKLQQPGKSSCYDPQIYPETNHLAVPCPFTASTELAPNQEICHESAVQLQATDYVVLQTQHDLLTQLTFQTGLLDQVLSASSDMVFVLDRKQRFTYTNSVSRRVLKVERHYILGKTLQEIEPFAFEKEFIAHCERVFATGQTMYAELTIPATHENKIFEYSLNPIYGVNNDVDAVICVAKDITKQKRTDLAIQEAEKNYHNVFEFANDSIFISDPITLRILNVNQKAARRLGYARQELLQLTMNDVIISLDANRREKLLQELQATGNTVFEHQQRHKNGKVIPVEFSCHMIEYEGKLAIQSFVRDITEYKRTEERLRQLEVALARAANVNATELPQLTSNSLDINLPPCADEGKAS
jgi:PAS domain S-box-containing protein